MAEKEAWRIAEQHGLDLVTIHPVFVVGPVLSDRDDAASVQMIVVRGQRRALCCAELGGHAHKQVALCPVGNRARVWHA